jgi:hypothetical protein
VPLKFTFRYFANFFKVPSVSCFSGSADGLGDASALADASGVGVAILPVPDGLIAEPIPARISTVAVTPIATLREKRIHTSEMPRVHSARKILR